MGLETGTTISQLNSAWPLSSDNASQGDDHLRLIKAILQAQFPGVGGAGFASPITATETELNYVDGVTSPIQTQLNTHTSDIALKAPLASPALTGTPTAPTASTNDRSTKIATTAFANPAATIGTNGYVTLPCGIMVQWEAFTVPLGGVSHSFATAFPTACLGVIGQADYAFIANVACYSLTRTSVSISVLDVNQNNISRPVWLWSLGY